MSESDARLQLHIEIENSETLTDLIAYLGREYPQLVFSVESSPESKFLTTDMVREHVQRVLSEQNLPSGNKIEGKISSILGSIYTAFSKDGKIPRGVMVALLEMKDNGDFKRVTKELQKSYPGLHFWNDSIGKDTLILLRELLEGLLQ